MSNPWLFGDSRSCRLSSWMEVNRRWKQEYDLLRTKYLREKSEMEKSEMEKSEMEISSLTDVLKRLVSARHVALQSNEAEQYEKMEVDDDDEISGTAEASPGMFGIRRFVQESSGVVSEERGWAKNYEFEQALPKQAKEVLERHGHDIVLTNLHFASERLQTRVNYNGVLVWKIEGHQRKRQDAINGIKTALYSPYFYTSEFGYKMCAKIYMNGDGFGKGSHLSLFFVVMRGEYDALQTWPMQKKITMMFLNQGNEDHMIDAFHSDAQSSSFQRPKSDMNIAFGSPLFMPLGSLNDRQYIKDDVMFIKIIVE